MGTDNFGLSCMVLLHKLQGMDLAGSGNVNLSLIDGWSVSKYSLIVNLNIDNLFVASGALRAEIVILKPQMCTHLQARALAYWDKQIHQAAKINQR